MCRRYFTPPSSGHSQEFLICFVQTASQRHSSSSRGCYNEDLEAAGTLQRKQKAMYFIAIMPSLALPIWFHHWRKGMSKLVQSFLHTIATSQWRRVTYLMPCLRRNGGKVYSLLFPHASSTSCSLFLRVLLKNRSWQGAPVSVCLTVEWCSFHFVQNLFIHL